MRTKSNVNAFVFGEEARRDFGEEKEKNEEGGGGTITMKSIESNVSKLERMTPVFSRELMAFVSGNKSELYEKRRKRNVGGRRRQARKRGGFSATDESVFVSF